MATCEHVNNCENYTSECNRLSNPFMNAKKNCYKATQKTPPISSTELSCSDTRSFGILLAELWPLLERPTQVDIMQTLIAMGGKSPIDPVDFEMLLMKTTK